MTEGISLNPNSSYNIDAEGVKKKKELEEQPNLGERFASWNAQHGVGATIFNVAAAAYNQ